MFALISGHLSTLVLIHFHFLLGTGKTYLVRALASQTKKGKVFRLSFLTIKQELLSKPDKFFAGVFEFIEQNRPSLLFFDDLDFLKDAFLNQLKNFLKLTKAVEGVVVVGATERGSEKLSRIFDLKIRLSGQIDHLAKCEIVKVCMRDVANELSEQDFMALGVKMKYWSAGEINENMKEIVRYSLRSVRDATHFKKVSVSAIWVNRKIPILFILKMTTDRSFPFPFNRSEDRCRATRRPS